MARIINIYVYDYIKYTMKLDLWKMVSNSLHMVRVCLLACLTLSDSFFVNSKRAAINDCLCQIAIVCLSDAGLMRSEVNSLSAR